MSIAQQIGKAGFRGQNTRSSSLKAEFNLKPVSLNLNCFMMIRLYPSNLKNFAVFLPANFPEEPQFIILPAVVSRKSWL